MTESAFAELCFTSGWMLAGGTECEWKWATRDVEEIYTTVHATGVVPANGEQVPCLIAVSETHLLQ